MKTPPRPPESEVMALLRRYESRNVTFIDPDGSWPIVWERAQGNFVWDEMGRRYLDLTAAFGVAAAGHANRNVVQAGQKQMARLLHAMGDVHPHALKARLARTLSEITFERWSRGRVAGKTIFCNAGFEAVEAALKTARLATGRPGVLAFEGGYHGLGYGALNVTHRAHFRGGFLNQLREFGHFIPFPTGPAEASLAACEADVRKQFRLGSVGAILVEPVQARGGIQVAPRGFLRLLRRLCDEHGALLIVDEIYTGFGRTGRWFACEHDRVLPDLICLGKALSGGFPLSACVGQVGIMEAWPPSTGEAIHTSTFLGHPVGCAMALAQIGQIQSRALVDRSEAMGRALLARLRRLHHPTLLLCPRGLGLMAGVEVLQPDGTPAGVQVIHLIKRLLHGGYVFLPEGEQGQVLSFTPPLTITSAQLERAVDALQQELLQIP